MKVRANNGEVSNNDLKIKSLEIAKELNIENFMGSNGYIDKWKKRFNVKLKVFSGEEGSVDKCVVNETSLKCELIETNEESNETDDIIIDYKRESGDQVIIQSMTNPNSTDVIKAVNIIKKILKNQSHNGVNQFVEIEKEIYNTVDNCYKKLK
jgi:hypothetical protein